VSEPAVFMTARRLRLPLFLLGAMLAFAPMALSTNARANVFTDVQAAVADVLESDNETGGYAVGLLAIIVILLIVIVFMGAVKSENPLFLSVAALAGVAFVPAAQADPGAALEVNVIAVARLLAEAKRRRASGALDPVVLIIGSGEQYGRHDATELPLVESAEQRPHSV